MISKQDAPGGARTADGATNITVRPLGPADTAPLSTFAKRQSVGYVYLPLCHGWDTFQHAELRARPSQVTPEAMPALAAVTASGTFVAAGWAYPTPGKIDTAAVVLVVEEHYRPLGVVSALLAKLATEVKARGFHRIVISVMVQTLSDLSDLRRAGLYVISATNLGGITKLVLAIE